MRNPMNGRMSIRAIMLLYSPQQLNPVYPPGDYHFEVSSPIPVH